MTARESTVAVFAVSGMHCASCGMLIDEAVEELDGVASCTTDVRRGRTTVRLDPARTSSSAVLAAISAAGYTAAPLADTSSGSSRRIWRRAGR